MAHAKKYLENKVCVTKDVDDDIPTHLYKYFPRARKLVRGEGSKTCFNEVTIVSCVGGRQRDYIWNWFFSFIFLWVFVYMYMYLCRPSEASTRYCAIPGGYPPQD
jgi:hypothetical protein